MPTPNPGRQADHSNLGWLAVGLALLWLLYLLAPVLTPFFLAAIFAYIFQPLVLRLGRRGLSRTIAVLGVLLAEALILVVMVLTVLPLFIKEISQAAAQLPDFLDRMDASVAPWIRDKTGFAVALDATSLKAWLRDMIQTTEGLGSQVLRSVRL